MPIRNQFFRGSSSKRVIYFLPQAGPMRSPSIRCLIHASEGAARGNAPALQSAAQSRESMRSVRALGLAGLRVKDYPGS